MVKKKAEDTTPILRIAQLYKISNGISKVDIYHSVIENGENVIFSTDKDKNTVKAILVAKDNVQQYQDLPLSILYSNYHAMQVAFDEYRNRLYDTMLTQDTRAVA